MADCGVCIVCPSSLIDNSRGRFLHWILSGNKVTSTLNELASIDLLTRSWEVAIHLPVGTWRAPEGGR
ncbi:uncharacterized protein B0I36DRAFT_318405 [Microdochium trichocladiopsis]|uniref:Uncharacterized protein n=1 Tax=Microdochium trichocladiopsis TaxID=1682393 RepID=A0A9P8YCK4_9PEZI|nr:uncharacterized protein B0I36DRAFT_318405 [Microdochium trichocladiopsis]KAH7035455.1 hypothetical protein B0I36DRAFT_318405 [Microdochium trichocladiopsis]